MSRNATATVYARILTEPGFRGSISADLLADCDLTEDERAALLREAHGEIFAHPARSEVMSGLRSGPALSPRIASALGAALNLASGLPATSVKDRGHTSGASDCCPWNKPPVPWREGISK
jgi:hypothetical protein